MLFENIPTVVRQDERTKHCGNIVEAALCFQVPIKSVCNLEIGDLIVYSTGE